MKILTCKYICAKINFFFFCASFWAKQKLNFNVISIFVVLVASFFFCFCYKNKQVTFFVNSVVSLFSKKWCEVVYSQICVELLRTNTCKSQLVDINGSRTIFQKKVSLKKHVLVRCPWKLKVYFLILKIYFRFDFKDFIL